jgi:hypothetical protein
MLRGSIQVLALAGLVLAPACATATMKASSSPPPRGRATRLVIPEPAFRDVQVVAEKSLPPKFVFEWDMPTPGYRAEVDSLDVDAEAGRIVARVTEVRPAGPVAQVITPATFRLPLGVLDPGSYVVEIWLRRGTDEPYRPQQALVVVASP